VPEIPKNVYLFHFFHTNQTQRTAMSAKCPDSELYLGSMIGRHFSTPTAAHTQVLMHVFRSKIIFNLVATSTFSHIICGGNMSQETRHNVAEENNYQVPLGGYELHITRYDNKQTTVDYGTIENGWPNLQSFHCYPRPSGCLLRAFL